MPVREMGAEITSLRSEQKFLRSELVKVRRQLDESQKSIATLKKGIRQNEKTREIFARRTRPGT
jgi:uncharacterized coiled-coil DUF342 family protein